MLIKPLKASGITLFRRSDGSEPVNLSTDTAGNLTFTDEYVKKVLNKPDGITLKELYTRVKGIYSNSEGQIIFRDEKLGKEYSLKDLVDGCKRWRDQIITGSLWWMNSSSIDHTLCANLPRKSEPLSPTLRFWSIDRFLYNLSKNGVTATCNSDDFTGNDSLFIDRITGDWKWYDIPGMQFVLPPITDPFKIGQILSKLSYTSYDSKEPVVFRIFDVTAGVELTRTAVVQCNPCEVSYPVTMNFQGTMPYLDKCKALENCGCVEVSCINGDPSCEDTSSLDKSSATVHVYETGSHLIKVQFHVTNYQNDHWSRIFGAEIDGQPITSSTIEAILFDTNTSGKFGKKQGTADFTKGTSVLILFDAPLASTEYSISLSPNKNINCWWDSKSVNGFRINSELAFTGKVDWTITNINANRST
jgi:hypothetical protein